MTLKNRGLKTECSYGGCASSKSNFCAKRKVGKFLPTFLASRKSAILQSSCHYLKTQQESKLLGHKSLTKNVGWWALIKPNLIHKSPGQTGKKIRSEAKRRSSNLICILQSCPAKRFPFKPLQFLANIFWALKRMNKSNMSCNCFLITATLQFCVIFAHLIKQKTRCDTGDEPPPL